jgi:Lamin Tail Domain
MITKSKFLLLCLHLALFHYAQGQSLVINEFMADNDPLTQIVDEVGQSDDWIELHNTTNTTINIGGYFLSDELGQLDKWQIPAGQSIGAFGYKIIWADADASQGPLHASFKLSKTGESIYLTNANAVILVSPMHASLMEPGILISVRLLLVITMRLHLAPTHQSIKLLSKFFPTLLLIPSLFNGRKLRQTKPCRFPFGMRLVNSFIANNSSGRVMKQPLLSISNNILPVCIMYNWKRSATTPLNYFWSIKAI